MPGILGAAGILLIAARLYRLPLETYLELSVPFFCFTHAWGRLGCFMAGCCHGVPTDSILGVQFPGNSIACKLHGYQPVHPTQLYEMALLVVLGLVAQFLIPLGHRVYSYFLIYGAARFVIELFRGDDRGAIGLIPSLSPSQQLCGIFILAGGILAWRTRTKTQRHAEIGDSSQ
jgi:phosphatidylglycerol:prolipoprotein diacylglycerol transferase